MKALLSLVIFVTCFIAHSQDYKDILIDEPVSLLDLMLFKANIKADTKEEQLSIKPIKLNTPEWLIQPKSMAKYLERGGHVLKTTSYKNLEAYYDFEKKNFSISYYLIYKHPNDKYINRFKKHKFDENNGLLKTTQKNFSAICTAYLDEISTIRLSPLQHSGYVTKSTRKLPEKHELLKQIEKDTNYKVVIVIEDDKESSFNGLEVECYRNSYESRFDEDYKDHFSFNGNWHLVN